MSASTKCVLRHGPVCLCAPLISGAPLNSMRTKIGCTSAEGARVFVLEILGF